MKFKFWVATLALILGAFPASSMADNATAQANVSRNFGNLPLSFEPTQTPGRFLSREGRYVLSLSARESSIAVRDSERTSGHILRFAFENSNPAAQLEAMDKLPGVSNYYVGRNSSNWRVGVPTFARLRAKGVYPGVDVVYYGDHRRLEFDFVVAPGADTKPIAISFSGLNKLYVADGDLVAEMEGQSIHFARPVAYQRVNGNNVPVKVEYSLAGGSKAELRIGDYDKSRELVIDPVISYATYLGGTQGDTANGLVVNAAGEAFVTGKTCSVDFFAATPNPSGTTFNGDAAEGACDAYVTKLSADGSTLLYTTFIAGTVPEPINATASGNGIALDAVGRAYVVGKTNFRDMPTLNAYYGGDSDAFITILNADGTLLRAAYLGGGSADTGQSIAVDKQLNVVVAGQTCSIDFPAYEGFQAITEACAAFATKLDFGLHIPVQGNGESALSHRPPSLSDGCPAPCPAVPDSTKTYYFFSVVYNGQIYPPAPTWPGNGRGFGYPGSGLFGTIFVPQGAITVGSFRDCSPSAVLTPYIMFAEGSGFASGLQFTCGTVNKGTRIADNGNFNWNIIGPVQVPVFATTKAFGVALDPLGDVFAVGGTSTKTLDPFNELAPTGPWILKVRGNDGTRIYSTGLSATTTDVSETIDAARAVTVDSDGRAYIVGTATTGLRTTSGALHPTPIGGQDAFVMRLNTAGSGIDYSTYLGGTGNDEGLGVAVDAGGSAYITGVTSSADLPVLNALADSTGLTLNQLRGTQDAYVAKLSPDGSTSIMMAYLGGSATDQGNAIDVNPKGDIFVAGNTSSADFPIIPAADLKNPVPGKTTYAGNTDAFVAMILGSSFPKVSITPVSLDFGSLVVNTATPATKTVAIHNTGTGILHLLKFTITGDFTLQTNTCGTQLTPVGGTKDNCTLTLSFTPTAVGTRTGVLTVVDDATDSPQTIGLTGNGIVVQSTVSPYSLPFGDQPLTQTSSTKTVTVSNTDATQTLLVTSVVASTPSDFTVTANSCTASIAPGGSCTISVSFTPTVAGARTGTIVINGNGSAMPATVSLTGNGTTAQAGAADFTLTGPPSAVRIAAGATGTFDVSVAPVNGFKQKVTLTCAAPFPATCSINPVTLDATAASSATVTIVVPGSTGSLPRGARNRRPFEPVFAFCIVGIALVGRRRQFWIAALVVVCCLALAFTGCGGGGGSSSGGSSGMAAGNYPLSVTATYTSGTTTLTHTVNVGLTVQ